MQLDTYQAETALIARRQERLLDAVRERLNRGDELSELEQQGVLHALQVLIENCIGKAKHLLKASAEPIPTSAYDAFSSLIQIQRLPGSERAMWESAVGLRNRIVHDYMNIDMQVVLALVAGGQYRPLAEFLRMPFSSAN